MNQEVGEKWEARFQKKDGYRLSIEEIINFPRSEYIKKIVRAVPISGKEKVLEAGCGSGKFSIALASKGCKVTAMDYSPKMVQNVKEHVKAVETYFGKLNVNAEQGSIEKMKYDDNSFDVVLNEGVVEHWLDDSKRIAVVEEMARVAKPEGKVIIIVPNGRHPLHKWWVFSKYPGYISAPPMFNYNVNLLKRDMEKAGLKDVQTDGLDPYTTPCQWPNHYILRLMRGGLKRILPPPKLIKEIFGVNLFAIGNKK